MVKVTLKDDVVKEFQSGTTVMDIAKSIGMGLYKAACLAKIDGETCDLRTPVTKDCHVEILTFDDEDGKKAFWHTTSHILAQAVKRLYPSAKLAIGPSIANGFYYDFDVDFSFTPEILEKIEAEMKKIVKENIPLEQFDLSADEALKLMEEKDEPYKIKCFSVYMVYLSQSSPSLRNILKELKRLKSATTENSVRSLGFLHFATRLPECRSSFPTV